MIIDRSHVSAKYVSLESTYENNDLFNFNLFIYLVLNLNLFNNNKF